MASIDWTPLDLVSFYGVHPYGNGPQIYTMRDGLRECYRGRGIWWMYLDGLFIPDVLINPSGAWCDLKRLGFEDGYCLAGIPTGEHMKFKRDIPQGYTFCVFVNSNFRVMNYGWEEEAPQHKGWPVGHDDPTRFGERLWPKL
jgi:hypothetical protein